MEKNEITVKQLYTLGYSLLESPPVASDDLNVPKSSPDYSVEARHKQAEPLDAEVMSSLRKTLGVSFRAVLKLELAKKRGTSQSSDSK